MIVVTYLDIFNITVSELCIFILIFFSVFGFLLIFIFRNKILIFIIYPTDVLDGKEILCDYYYSLLIKKNTRNNLFIVNCEYGP